jgi:uncharacterized OsmC-like protein
VSDSQDENKYIGVNHAHGKMIGHATTEIYIRHFPALISDEPPSRGGKDMGQSPLEMILAALCA